MGTTCRVMVTPQARAVEAVVSIKRLEAFRWGFFGLSINKKAARSTGGFAPTTGDVAC